MRKPLIALLLAIPALTCANPLSSQLNAVAAAEQQGEREEASRQAQEEAARQAHLRHEQVIAAQRQRAAAQARLKREQQQLAAQREAHQERIADKQREQSYQDQLRQMELENMKMEMDARRAELELSKARNHARSKLVDEEQKNQMQLDAAERRAEISNKSAVGDAIRNESEGDKHLKERMGSGIENAGKAAADKASGWFN
ncbi:DUF5384 family protein [Edwardsiella piscicida]|uniref:DUF5384 family protein n=1 Tax=Edwardsiella piscicida TaxID=1263550 RepID=UPI000D51A32E|nr:DUF5384 family protein [Edwardsiella piscicida]EKS7813912.1 DUF5384 family protein [Edwardsiella piscicida]UCQ20617.1 DUF5384 family protein [Edwardsiella piscicida]